MKHLLIVLFCFFFISSAFAQYVEQKKEKKEEKTEIEVIQHDSVVVIDLEENTDKQKSYRRELSPNKINYSYKKNKTLTLNSSDKDKEMEFFYPVSRYEAYVGYVSLNSPVFLCNGGYFHGVIRQNPDIKNKTLKNAKTWGVYVEGGMYNIKVEESKNLTTEIKTQVIGGGISFAMTRNKPGWNAMVINAGFSQEIENGNSGLFEWRQNDVMMNISGWVDLTRNNQNIFFSRTNLSWFWKKVLSARRSALYEGQETKSEIWNKESLGMEIQQTMLMFYLGDDIGLHFGVTLGYQHYSQDSRDWYSPGAFVELHNKYYKVGQISFQKTMRSHGNDLRDSYNTVKASIDFYQLAQSMFF